MSFSSDTREELSGVFPTARHCMIAELAGLFSVAGSFPEEGDPKPSLTLRTEQILTARKVFTLIHKAFKITLENTGTSRIGRRNQPEFVIALKEEQQIRDLRDAFSHKMLLSMECCRRSYLRGAFLAAGTISAPEKYYHLEIVCPDEAASSRVQDTMRSLDLDAKTVVRKGSYVVYLKEVEQIVRTLGLMGAGISLLEFENIRITREMRGSINRKVNCETANLQKTVAAAVRQIEDIQYLREHTDFGELPLSLQEMAEVRLQYPEAALTELGRYLHPPVGKSGVNHRLRKLQELAAQWRVSREDKGEKE